MDVQTRRSTRRSLANEQGVENDLSNRVGTGPAQSRATTSMAVKPAAAGKPSTSTSALPRRAAGQGKSILADKSAAANATAGARGKRSAFSDVTNASKAKAGTSAAADVKPKLRTTTTTAAPTATTSSNAPVRRTYRTRSSTGGGTSAVKQEPQDARLDGGEDDGPSDAMAIDDETVDKPAPAAARPVRGMRRTTSAKSASASTSAAVAPVAGRRAPLAAKRANQATSTTTAAAAAKGKGKSVVAVAAAAKATPAPLRVARKRREEAEARHARAAAELEVAKRAEEAELKRAAAAELEELEVEENRRVKKQRTSEPDHRALGLEDEDDDDGHEVESEEDEEGPRMSKWEEEVEGARPKDYGWEDLDEGDEEDPLMVSTYVVEVYDYLRELELTTMPDPDYMSNQNEVTWKMRGILVDWLVEIHTKFRLLPETIFLAVNIIDRFLSVRVVSLVKFQLVGVTALFIAAKYEEVVCPSVQNFLYMTDGGYTDDEILKAERYVLGIIGFNLSYPNPINFLRRISKADGYDIHSRTMAKYLMEISIVDHRFMATPPSLIAAGASWLARRVLGKEPWDANLVHYSGYSEDELRPTAQLMLDYVVRTSPLLTAWALNAAEGDEAVENPLEMSPGDHEVEHPNFVKKYGAKKFFKASTAVRKWAETEYAPLEDFDPEQGLIIRKPILALL
ncbi:cyclin family protein [Rhodotorula paludigena]|uniref:cyclin family protein n=1 Tax=Rhodotorula paludigena TaxID=86838 RepID=UPI00316BA6AD